MWLNQINNYLFMSAAHLYHFAIFVLKMIEAVEDTGVNLVAILTTHHHLWVSNDQQYLLV